MRTTTHRGWTPAEVSIADRLGDAIDAARGVEVGKVSGLVGALNVGIAAGLPHRSPADRVRTRDRVYDLMPLACERHPDRHRGRALVVIHDGGLGVYYSTADVALIIRDLAHRVLGMRTSADRMLATARPLSKSKRLVVATVRSQLAQLDGALDPGVWDAILTDLAR